jgi:hypothetical protein
MALLRKLEVYAGTVAREQLAKEGWRPGLFETLVGASGGAKFLGLGHLDRFLFGDFLQRENTPLQLIGSSIGSWRHAALACPDPVAALDRLQQGYIQQRYAQGKPSPALVSQVSQGILKNFLGTDGVQAICDHPRFSSHIVTARGRGPTGSATPALQGLGLGLAAISNTLHRQLLQAWFQRVVFSSHPQSNSGFQFTDFASRVNPLVPENTLQALHASGSIPFILTGERDIPGASRGQYWDGGIVDYHFDLRDYRGEGLLLYPHFRADLTPGWFDKFLPWRRVQREALQRVVLLCPSSAYLETLPMGKIPDRGDFGRLDDEQRVEYWQNALARSVELAEEFAELVNGPDPLAGVQHF